MVNTIIVTGIDQCLINQEKTEITFLMKLKNLPSHIVEIAKTIDKENYEPDCFGFQFNYQTRTKTYYIKKQKEKALYYLDINGDMHYISYDIPENITTSAVKKCNKELQKRGIKQKRRSPNTKGIKSAKQCVAYLKQPDVSPNKEPMNIPAYLKLIFNKKNECPRVSGQYTLF